MTTLKTINPSFTAIMVALITFTFAFPTANGWAQGDQALDHLIPQDAVFYVGSHSTPPAPPEYPNYNQGMQNLLDSLNDFLEWRVLQALMQTTEEEQAQHEAIDFSNLQGSRWAFAVYGLGESSWQLPSLLYVTQLDSPQQARAALKRLFDNAAGYEEAPVVIEHEQINGVTLYAMHGPGMIPGLSIAAAIKNDRLWMSNSKPGLLSILNSETWPDESLRENPTYQTVLNKLPRRHSVTLFANYQPLGNGLQTLLEKITAIQQGFPTPEAGQSSEASGQHEDHSRAPIQNGTQADPIPASATGEVSVPSDSRQLPIDGNEFETQVKHWASIPKLGQAIKVLEGIAPFLQTLQAQGVAWEMSEAGKSRTTAFTYLDTDVLGDSAQSIQQMLHRQPVNFAFHEYLPHNTGTYSAWNWLDLEALWNTVRSIASETEAGREAYNAFEDFQNEFNVSLQEDIFAWLGDEMAQVRPVMDLNAVVPVNQMAWLVRVTDAEQARTGITNLVRQFIQRTQLPIHAERQTYRGRTLTTYASVIPMLPVVPAWGLDGEVLIVTTHAELLRTMLDVKDGVKPGIARNRHFRNYFSDLLDRPLNSVMFQDVENEMIAVREALTRVASFSQLGEAINRDREMLPFMLMDRVAYALRLMQIYKASTKQTVLENDGILSTKEVVMRDLTSVPKPESMLRYKLSLGAKPFIAKLGKGLYEKDETELAIRVYEVLAEFYPTNIDYLTTLAEWHERQGDIEAAKQVYDQALQAQPRTETLVAREALDPEAGAPAILQRVANAAKQSNRIDESLALFKLALTKRDAGQLETAKDLLMALIEKHPFSPLTSAAEAERALLNNEPLKTFIDVPVKRYAPIVDGRLSDPAWDEAPVISLHFSAGETQNATAFSAQAKVLRSRTTFYVGLRGADAIQWATAGEENLIVTLNPQRDYKHLKEFVTQIERRNGERVINRTLNHKTVTSSLVDFDENAVDTQSQPGDWKAEHTRSGDEWQAELAIPLRTITREVEGIQTTWTFNIARVLKEGGAFIQQSANGEGPIDNPVLHLYAELR